MSIREEAPELDLRDAQRIVADLWELPDAQARDLGSHQDRNFLITTPGARHVLKVANTAIPDGSLDAQNAAMLAVSGLPVRTPRPIPSRAGALREVVDLGGMPHSVRLLTYVEGAPMTGSLYFAPVTARQFGALAGQVSAALAGFTHPGAELANQWDVRRSGQVVADLVPALDHELAARVRLLSAQSQEALDELDPQLPRQVIHADVTDFNVVADLGPDARPVPAGIIDFGDLMHTWRAAEAAVTICALLVKDARAPLRVAEDVLRGFLAEQSLTAVEIAALWPMVAGRACAGLVSTAHQLSSEPDNPYLHENLAVDSAVFAMVADLPLELGTLAMLRAAGLLGAPEQVLATEALVLPGLGPVTPIDLSTTSPLLDEGAWTDPDRVRAAIRSAVAAATPRSAVIAYGQAHLHHSQVDSLAEPATIHLGLDVLLPRGSQVVAPWPGSLAVGEPWVTHLVGDEGWDLLVSGAEPLRAPGTRVASGAPIAAVTTSRAPALPDHVHVQVVRTGVTAPTHAPASLAQLWRHLCPDPGALLGLEPVTPQPGPNDLMRRREAALASVQKHYYAEPPRIERGWRHHLADVSGRVYLDGINNVTVLGHSHPSVARAVDRALRTLNTNSRFHYAAHVEFAEMLLETMPAGLDRVFLLSSGSETVDLALRLARVHTGARDTIALRTAYHGWTTASDEVSSALMDNPRALETRPDWIHLAEPPNLYRGPFTGPDAGTRYADDVRRILAELASAGRRPAAFICETLNGNAGGIELPGDYLPQVYDAVRAAGGLVIADEVQVGYGRLGSHFWGFEMSEVVPDIVCLAKATGNGYPVSAVVCRREIAESFAAEGSLFASMGGTPAGAVAAIATLTTLRDEDLMGNAHRMGARLRAGLEALVERHPMAGAVHGRGLYLGLELVTDRETRTPATEATDALCERLLTLGVVMAATGDHMNVLKIKPPLCIDAAGVDFLLEALEVAFTEGW
ncbi:MAG: aminotransferase [Candidatus Nanopelagicales bacterium]|jgi:4-aminobutyrate aminotransferase-like enzyme/Ser/Thr protein kinase RdoA (MazF antagonist)|nr:aminotransferase [Candidatus Nanopelagicales bacterium]